jgi:hypothetical protein
MLLRSELHGCLARVESFLVRVGAALGTSLEAPEASPPHGINVSPTDVGEEGLYGGFSPRARPSPMPRPNVSDANESEVANGLMALMMLIMPELQELCGESVPPPSMLHKEVDSFGSSEVAYATLSLEASQSLVSEDLFAKELCDLLITLEAAIPGSSKEIASLLSEKATGDKIKRVKEYLRGKSKKSNATRKASAAA